VRWLRALSRRGGSSAREQVGAEGPGEVVPQRAGALVGDHLAAGVGVGNLEGRRKGHPGQIAGPARERLAVAVVRLGVPAPAEWHADGVALGEVEGQAPATMGVLAGRSVLRPSLPARRSFKRRGTQTGKAARLKPGCLWVRLPPALLETGSGFLPPGP